MKWTYMRWRPLLALVVIFTLVVSFLLFNSNSDPPSKVLGTTDSTSVTETIRLKVIAWLGMGEEVASNTDPDSNQGDESSGDADFDFSSSDTASSSILERFTNRFFASSDDENPRSGGSDAPGDGGSPTTDIVDISLVEEVDVWQLLIASRHVTNNQLNTDFYSSYQDLKEEGYLNASSGSDLLTLSQANYLYAPITSISSSSVSNLSDLGDVNTTDLNTGQVLKWDGTEWKPANDNDTNTDTDTDTIYTAGSGLTLSDSTFSLGGSLTSNSLLQLDSFNISFMGPGEVGIGVSDPNSWLDLAAATADKASLRLRTGSTPTSPNQGDLYSDGTNLYFHNGSTWDDLTSTGDSSIWSLNGTSTYYTLGGMWGLGRRHQATLWM